MPGYHWMYRKQAGEPQLTFNYVAALSNFITNFCFSKGFDVKVNKMFEHITPALLDRVFTKDNNKPQFLWTMGQMGSVSGDTFIKIAYADPGTDGADPITGAGRCLLMNLHPAHCFPTWHPHIPGKMLKFKQKYKFWDTMPDGTRAPCTYVEEITDDWIKEWLNDELIRETPNLIGMIPVVHIANVPVAGSPWGLSDIESIIPINREYNEKATEISDIINYHVAPVTIVKGAKPGSMEKGAAKMWYVPGEKADVYNLEGGFQGLGPALEFLEVLRIRMHEQGHVPENALGQAQPISNTSGVALAIQYMPTTQWAGLKVVQYGEGLKHICMLILKTLFLKEPQSVLYDPTTSGILDPDLGQQDYISPMDPQVYDVEIDFKPPLPVDELVTLNTELMKVQLGVQSKKGVLKALGEEFPDEKLAELEEENRRDRLMSAEDRLYNAAVDAGIMTLTGVVPSPDGNEPVESEPPSPGNSSTTATAPQQVTAKTPPLPPGVAAVLEGGQDQIMNEIVTKAFGPRVPIRRNYDEQGED